MTDSDWGLIERRRLQRARLCLVAIAAGAALIGLSVALWAEPDRGGRLAGIVGVVAVLAGLACSWIFRPGEAFEQIQRQGGYRDRVQREHISRVMALPAASLGLTVIGMNKAAEWLDGERDFGGGLLALAVVLNILMLPILVMGWDGGSRKMKRFLDDELTRAYRAQAMTAAFWVLMPGVMAVYLVGMWKPHWGVIALPGVLWLAAATASLRYALLHRAAERDE